MAPSSQEGGARWDAAGCGSSGLLILQVNLAVSDVHFSLHWLNYCFTFEVCVKVPIPIQTTKVVEE